MLASWLCFAAPQFELNLPSFQRIASHRHSLIIDTARPSTLTVCLFSQRLTMYREQISILAEDPVDPSGSVEFPRVGV